MKKVLVTGCAGFIGSNLVNYLLKKNLKVTGIDNLTTGNIQNIRELKKNKKFNFYKKDLLLTKNLSKYFKNQDLVIHLAANADVKNGLKNNKIDLEQNTIATYNVLEATRVSRIKEIIFSSTGSIYGEAISFPTKEDDKFPIQTSLYGASKLACEGLIQAYSEGYGIKSWIYRFVSVLGKNYSHGHIYDFCKKLKKNTKELQILGNGFQNKSYVHVDDCIDAMFLGYKKSKKKINIFNIGTEETINVRQSVHIILSCLSLKPKLFFTNNKRGWVGDNPKIFLSINRLKKLGWKPKKNIKSSIIETVKYVQSFLK